MKVILALLLLFSTVYAADQIFMYFDRVTVQIQCDNFNRVYVNPRGGIAVTRLDPQCR